MTQTKQQCSTLNQLLSFLRGQLSAREEADLQHHLDDCVSCRERLESTAADVSIWNEAREFFASGALHGSSKDSSEDHEEAGQVSQRIRQVLDSLGPTDDPESLGRIGGYEVIGVVGAGGMGVVLKAHDRSLDRIVAIKVMSPHLASSGSARKRFAREAKAAAAVLHPNVIAIHSVTSEDANPYLVMPFVRGTSLQKRIDSQGPLPLKDTLRIGSQIAAGLAAAHDQGLVHRDIKPANILLEEGVERVTITDFGLARAVDDASMTCSGVIAGTPQYMSPEQARGEPIDARSDLFSLGGVLYAMCTGRSPFRAETTYGVLHRIANDKPTPVCEVNTDVPVWLGHVIERLMAKRPEDRFDSAAQVAELLEGCLAHVQQPAVMPLPEAVTALAQNKTRRPPIGKFIAAAVFGLAFIFAAVFVVLELNKGTLTIQSDLDDIRVRITRGKDVVNELKVTQSGQSVRLTAGQYEVELIGQADGLTVQNGHVTLHRADTEVVKITHNTHDTHDTNPPTFNDSNAAVQTNRSNSSDSLSATIDTVENSSRSTPEYPPVKIVVHDEEGKPLEGVKVGLYQVAKDQGGQVLEINETSSVSGLAVNRSLPYGHYKLSVRTSDGWSLGYGSRLNVEFEKGLDVVLIAPTARKIAKLVIGSDLGPSSAAINELRFGQLEKINGQGYIGDYAPEPTTKPMDGEIETQNQGSASERTASLSDKSYGSFPSVASGIEYVGAEIDLQIKRSIPQSALSLQNIHTTWEWYPTENDKLKRRYLVAKGQARNLKDNKYLHLSPLDSSQFFKLPGPSHRVMATLLELGEPAALPLELDIPAGDIKIYIGRFYGKPNAAVLAALNWRQQAESELWLEAHLLRESAWIERLMNATDWVYSAPGEGSYIVSGHLLRREVSLKAGETLEVWLAPKSVDHKPLHASEARTLDDITSIYNEQTRQLRNELFTPPIPDLTTAQMREAMLDAAEQYRKQGRVEVSSALKTSAEANRLADRLTFTGMGGIMSDDFRQITPQFNFEAASNSALMVVLGKAELRYSRNGWSSKTWGDIHPPITGKWELVSVEQLGKPLTKQEYEFWSQAEEGWIELTIDATSLTMAGENAAKLDLSIDYATGPLPQYTISQNGHTMYSGVLAGNGFVDNTTLSIAVDLEGKSKVTSFNTQYGKTTTLSYRRVQVEQPDTHRGTAKSDRTNAR